MLQGVVAAALLTFGPKVVWTASASMSTPRSIEALASVPKAISFPVAKPRLAQRRLPRRPSSWSEVESIVTPVARSA